MNALTIEDEPAIALVLRRLPEDPAPDLVLVDLFVPGLSGRDVVAAMRADARLTGIPVFAGWGGEHINIAKTNGDQPTRVEAMVKAERTLPTDLAIAPVFHPAWNYIEKPYVHGIQRFATGSDYEFKFTTLDPH